MPHVHVLREETSFLIHIMTLDENGEWCIAAHNMLAGSAFDDEL